jgi:hypothetical protein
MREPFAHDAVVVMDSEGDVRAPGAAITVALCGHWEHEPPCPLAPHHTSARRVGPNVELRTLFVAEPGDEVEVRGRIAAALGAGQLGEGTDTATRWRLLSNVASMVRSEERDHAKRLAGG